MKNKSIINICKKENIMMILSSTETEPRWISCGAAIYQFGLQDVSCEELCYLYDIDDNKRQKMVCSIANLPSKYDFADTTVNETPAIPLNIILQFDGKIVQPYSTSLGVLCIDLEYLAPFNLKDRSEMFVFVRVATNNIPYFAIKIGLLIRAIIMPLKISRKNELFDNLNQIANTSYIFDEDKQ